MPHTSTIPAAAAPASSEEDDDPGSSRAADEPADPLARQPPRGLNAAGGGDPPAPLDVELTLVGPDCDPPAAGWLEHHVRRAARVLGVAGGSVSLVLLPDDEMADAHARYLDVPAATDVITFDLGDGGEDGALDGELLLGLGVAARQAAERNHDTRLELLLYAVHGLLHLLGEDDRTDAGYRRMHDRENRVLTELGFAPLFGEIPAADRGDPSRLDDRPPFRG